MNLKLLIFSLAPLCVICKVFRSQGKCPPVVEYMYSFDYALDDHVIKKFHMFPEDWCLAKCNLNKRCRSVNYNRKLSSTYNCELNSGTNQQYPNSYNPRPGWVYYENRIADTLPIVVDGGWGDWGPWSWDCPTNCLRKEKRTRTRTRTCTNPAPQGDGIYCSGKNTEQQICESPGCFELFQTFRTTHGTAVTSFELENEVFVAFTNYRDGSYRGYGDIHFGYKSILPVYVLQQNNFTLNQTLVSFGAKDVEYFTIHGDHFLTVANAYDGLDNKEDSVVYRWEAGKFKEFQRIPTIAVADTHFFTINTRKLILFSSPLYGSSQVSIYEWKNEKFSKKIQDIKISYLTGCNTFSIQNITYIACGRGVSANAVTVLKWSGRKFEPFQDLPSSIVHGHPHSFLANGTFYLAIPNRHNSGNNNDIDSFIYRWNGAKFVHHQSIPTHGAKGWDSFTTAAGELFLVVANSYTGSGARFNVKSAVYKMADNKFNLYQQLPTAEAAYVHAFIHKGKKYLAVVNWHGHRRYTANSSVYIWNYL